MRRTPKSLRIILIATLISALTQPIHAEELKQPRKIVTGWIPYYSMKTSLPSTLNNLDLIQEVMPFWYSLNYNGAQKKVVITDLYKPANPSVPISQPLTSLRNAGLRIIPTISDGTDTLVLAKQLANASARAQLVADISSFVATNGFDGIDLDLENFAFKDGNTSWATTAPLWVAFVKELSTALRVQKKLLSVTSPVVFFPTDKQKGYTVYSWQQIAPFIDRLRIMAYDYSLAKPGPIGPLSWAERSLQYAITVIPASKVFLGVPAYGRDWVTAVEGVCPANVASVIKVGAKAAAFVQRDALSLAQTYGVTPTFDEKFGEVTFTYKKVYNGETAAGLATSCTATRTVWYHDSRSFTLRAQLVGKYRLGGMAQWTIGMEDMATSGAVRDVARSIAPDKVNALINVDKNALNYGELFTVSGAFTLPDKSPVSGLTVWLETQGSDESWKKVYQGITTADGTWSFPLVLGKSTDIRLSSEGSWERSEALSTDIALTVIRKLSVDAPPSVSRGSDVTITGTVYPRAAGAQVQLQVPSGKAYKSVATALTDAQGNFTMTTPATSRGIVQYQVVVIGDAQWAQVSSASFAIVVR